MLVIKVSEDTTRISGSLQKCHREEIDEAISTIPALEFLVHAGSKVKKMAIK